MITVTNSSYGRTVLALILVLALFMSVAAFKQRDDSLQAAEGVNALIPSQDDWVDYGTILESGTEGEWDYYLWGGFTATTIKRDGTYCLYYQGARSYDEVEGTVTWRAVGVATSSDGINFTKAPNNPVMTWFPNDQIEEGAVSGGVTLDENGTFLMYYGANTHAGGSSVNADGRLATSLDGITFTDVGMVLDHTQRTVWGAGDELFPVVAFRDGGQSVVYYIPNGTPQSRQLGVAWGSNPHHLTNTAAVLSGGTTISAWGTGGQAEIAPDTYALFLNDVAVPNIEVRTLSLTIPHELSPPVQTYHFEDVSQATVLLDTEHRTWFMYYRDADSSVYGVKLAPAGKPDRTPPTAPTTLEAAAVSSTQIDLSWSPATDAETGIVQYKLYRDGIHVATIKGWSFSDTDLTQQRKYRYEVSAINYHGVEGPRSLPVTVTPIPPPGSPTPPPKSFSTLYLPYVPSWRTTEFTGTP